MKRRTFFAAAPLAVLPGSGVALADAPQLDQGSAVDPLVTLLGLTDEEIASVTGQSMAMVAHYTAHVRQKVRALKAQERRL